MNENLAKTAAKETKKQDKRPTLASKGLEIRLPSQCSSVSQPSIALEPRTNTRILKTHRKAKHNSYFLRMVSTFDKFHLDPDYILQVQKMYLKRDLRMHPFSPNRILSRINIGAIEPSMVKADSVIMLHKFMEILETRDFKKSCDIYEHLKKLSKR